MKYLLLLYHAESPELGSPEAMAEWGHYEEFLAPRGVKIAAAALHPTESATTISIRDGETLITDGPFADTKEQLGGFYLLECADLDEAIAIAARNPWAPTGHIEIRPVLNFG